MENIIDITPEEFAERVNKTILADDYPYTESFKHTKDVFSIKYQIAMNDNNPLYCIGFDNGKHFRVVSVLWKDLDFIKNNCSDESSIPNINRLNADYAENLKTKQLHVNHRRPMWFKPHTVTTKAHFEGRNWIPENTRFVDWDSPEGDKVEKNARILKIWQWEINLGLYKLYRITTPEKVELFT